MCLIYMDSSPLISNSVCFPVFSEQMVSNWKPHCHSSLRRLCSGRGLGIYKRSPIYPVPCNAPPRWKWSEPRTCHFAIWAGYSFILLYLFKEVFYTRICIYMCGIVCLALCNICAVWSPQCYLLSTGGRRVPQDLTNWGKIPKTPPILFIEPHLCTSFHNFFTRKSLLKGLILLFKEKYNFVTDETSMGGVSNKAV